MNGVQFIAEEGAVGRAKLVGHLDSNPAARARVWPIVPHRMVLDAAVVAEGVRVLPPAEGHWNSGLMSKNLQLIGEFAANRRLIMVGLPSYLIEAGVLFTYGPNVPSWFGWRQPT